VEEACEEQASVLGAHEAWTVCGGNGLCGQTVEETCGVLWRGSVRNEQQRVCVVMCAGDGWTMPVDVVWCAENRSEVMRETEGVLHGAGTRVAL
jgi:hypothetical protein